MTVVTIEPNGSATYVSAWTNNGGANLHSSLSDDTDTQYASRTTTPAFVGAVLDFPAPDALPAGAVAVSVNVQLRCIRLGSGGEVGFQTTFPSGIGGGTVLVNFNDWTTVYAFSAALSSWPSDFQGILFGGAVLSGTVYVSEVDVNLLYAAKPTVTVATQPVSPITDNDRPTVSWASTLDTDGGIGQKFEVKVFDDATYLGGGFNASSSTPDAQSGVVTGVGDRTWRVPDDARLVNDTYKFYVREAQIVNGEEHWSDWTAGAAFDISVAQPNTPTIVATGDDTNARIELVVTSGGGGTSSDFFEIQKSLDGGTTWDSVRTALGSSRISAAGTMYDYEVPNGTTATYRVRAIHSFTDFESASAWSSSDTGVWTSTSYWLKNPVDPTHNEAINVKSPASSGIESEVRQAVHQPLGFAEAVAITDEAGPDKGTLEFYVADVSGRADPEGLLDGGRVLLFQAPANLGVTDRYIALGNWTRTQLVDAVGHPRVVYSVPWTEVAVPGGPLA